MLLRILSFTILLLLTTTSLFGQISDINKTTGWYMTNECFQGQVDVVQTPFSTATLNLTVLSGYPSGNEFYGGNAAGYHLFCDLDNDGYNNFFRSMYRRPWPNGERGIIVHSKKGLTREDYTVNYGLTEPRKEIVTDFNNDGIKEILLFSQGMDVEPFPGDSLMLYHIDGDSVQYFDNVSFYHGGAVGDIDNDGDQDIITGFRYHENNRFFRTPEVYINEGDFGFYFDNSMFINFPDFPNGWFTVELYDLDNDGYLDLLIDGRDDDNKSIMIIVFQNSSVYNYEDKVIIDLSNYGFNSAVDIDFLDLDSDGNIELIFNYTPDYETHIPLVFTISDRTFEDVSNTYFPDFDVNDGWYLWHFLKDIDGDGDVDIIPDGSQWSYFYFENKNGIFKKIDSTPITTGYLYSHLPTTNPIIPFDGQENVETLTKFRWDDVEYKSSFHLQISRDTTFTSLSFESIELDSTTYTLTEPLEQNTQYYWRVRSLGEVEQQHSEWSDVLSFTTGVRTSVEEVVPTEYSLQQNYPNPFNPTTTITYSLPQSGMVTLNVYDITGRYVTTLVDGVQSVGTHTIEFDGGSLSSGMYVYTLQTDGYRQTRQMMLVK